MLFLPSVNNLYRRVTRRVRELYTRIHTYRHGHRAAIPGLNKRGVLKPLLSSGAPCRPPASPGTAFPGHVNVCRVSLFDIVQARRVDIKVFFTSRGVAPPSSASSSFPNAAAAARAPPRLYRAPRPTLLHPASAMTSHARHVTRPTLARV